MHTTDNLDRSNRHTFHLDLTIRIIVLSYTTRSITVSRIRSMENPPYDANSFLTAPTSLAVIRPHLGYSQLSEPFSVLCHSFVPPSATFGCLDNVYVARILS